MPKKLTNFLSHGTEVCPKELSSLLDLLCKTPSARARHLKYGQKNYFHLHRNISSLMPLCRRLRLSGEALIFSRIAPAHFCCLIRPWPRLSSLIQLLITSLFKQPEEQYLTCTRWDPVA